MEQKKDISYLLRFVAEKKGLLSFACLFSIISGVLQIVPFIAVFKIIEACFKHATNPTLIDTNLIRSWGLYALLGLVLSIVALYLGVLCSHVAAFQILYQLRIKLINHLSKIPMGYHTKTATGETKKIIETSVEKVEKFVAHQFPDLVTAIVIPIFLIGYLFWLDWRLALIIFLVVAVSLSMQMLVFANETGRTAYRDFQFAMEEMNATSVEFVRGMPAVKVFGIAAESFLTFKKAVDKYRSISLKITEIYRRPYSIYLILITSISVFILPAGIYLISQNPSNLAFVTTFVLFLIVAPSLAAPLTKLMYLGGGMREIAEGNRRIQEIFALSELIEPAVGQVPTNYAVGFKNVHFAYEDKNSQDYKEVLKGINFTAQAGEMTALVGPSGGGKSTIANLVLRFWEVTEGQIQIGGVGIDQMTTETLMDTVSFVFQDVQLFYDTIEENIRMGNQHATKEEVIAAAKIACCHEFIEKLPDEYQTKIGEKGTFLSGGEAQRLAIARALLKNAPILVLDEATAYADAENEYKIQQGLQELVKGKTVIMIAHRLTTIMRAEQILVVDQGTIVERGNHQDLLAKEGLYQRMWQAHLSATQWRLARPTEAQQGGND